MRSRPTESITFPIAERRLARLYQALADAHLVYSEAPAGPARDRARARMVELRAQKDALRSALDRSVIR